jgi:hypothetical protein
MIRLWLVIEGGDPRVWGGVVFAACAGLAVFLVAAEPRGGQPTPTSGHWLGGGHRGLPRGCRGAERAGHGRFAQPAGGAAQAALQAGPLRVSQPLLTIIDPVVSIALSVWLFGEYFVMNAATLAAASAGFCVMCVGVVVMSLTAPATLQADIDPAVVPRTRSG